MAKRRNTLLNLVEYVPMRLAVMCIDIMPVHTALAMARGAGTLMWHSLRRRRKLATDNILFAGITADRDEAARIAKESFQSFAMLTVESLIASKLITPDTLDQHVEMHIPDATAQLLADPARGGMFVSAHLGNWEVSGHIISFRKKLVAVARTMNNPYVQRFMERRNPRRNMDIIAKHSADKLSLLRPLKNGLMLGLISDQHATSNGVMVDFFGHPASTVTSPARLHLSTGCPLVCGYCQRIGQMRFKITCSEPLFYEKTADRDADIRRITADLNARLETLIRETPEQYLWAHRRWRKPKTAKPS